MKHLFRRGLLLAFLTLGLVFHLAAQSTQMIIHMNDGTERTYYMSESDRVYFENNEILVVEIAINAKSDRFNLADIRKITCHEVESTIEEMESPVWLSPNPSHDAFVLRNLKDKEIIRIYALDGRLVKSAEVTENQAVDISDLGIGLYLVKTQSSTLKMIKL